MNIFPRSLSLSFVFLCVQNFLYANLVVYDGNMAVDPGAKNHFVVIGTATEGGAPLSKTFVVRNEGDFPLAIKSIQNLGYDDFNQLQIQMSRQIESSRILEPHATLSFDVQLQPNKNWLHLGLVQIDYASVPNPANLQIERSGAGGLRIRFSGEPNAEYQIQMSDDLNVGWQDLETVKSDAQGEFSYETALVAPNRFYRAVTNVQTRLLEFKIAAAVGATPGLVCPGDSNNYVPENFSCVSKSNGTICGNSNGRTKVCNSSQCVLLGDLNNDGDVNLLDIDSFEYEITESRSNLAANFSCDGQFSNVIEDVKNFATVISLSGSWAYNSHIRTACSNPSELLATQGRALVYVNGPMNWQTLEFKEPTLVCVDNLGTYDSETGERTGGSAGRLSGKYGETELFTIDEYEPRYKDWNNITELFNDTNDFRVRVSKDSSAMQREEILWSSETQFYHDVNSFRSLYFNDQFISDLRLPAEIEKNLKVRQFRPDLDVGIVSELHKPHLLVQEKFWSEGLRIFDAQNYLLVPSRTRGPLDPYSSLPPMSLVYDSEVTLGDYAGLMANWILGSNKGFPSDAFYGQNSEWMGNVLSPVSNALSAWVAYRYTGNTEVYRYKDYSARVWAGRPCDGDWIQCSKGRSIKNVMMFDEANTSKDGVFPFSWPAHLPGDEQAFFSGADGPVASDLAALFLAGVYYDIAHEAGLGLRKTDLIVWKALSLILDSQHLSMREYGAKILEAVKALWPDGRYDRDVADVLTSRGIPVNGVKDFRENLPPAIGDANSLEVNAASKFGSQHPEIQPSLNYPGNFSYSQNGYTHSDQDASYVAYKFYKHSKYGPCDKIAFTDGTFNTNGNAPFNWAYNNDGSFYVELSERDLGNKVLFAPGRHIHWLRSRQRCPDQKQGNYSEDVSPFGFRVVQAVSEGFSFTSSLISQRGTKKIYSLTIMDPSINVSGQRTDYEWTIIDSFGHSTTLNGVSIIASLEMDEPFTVKIDRSRNGKVDSMRWRERVNDLDREGGLGFVKNALP